jgi:hypothetical protein
MKMLISSIVVGLLLATPLAADQKGKKHPKHERVHVDRAETHAAIHVVFSTHDVRIIRQHYATRYRNLPPGLQKKYARTGQLPPGWQKKLEPFPASVERELVVLPAGYRRGVIDGNAVIYNPRTQVIVDVAVLF